ncbi:OLC1v1013334C1 [Oldenlandia corymbosa var. corymbosa]|uniref:OLC1v1013334C1 n=1 Tax=Oldenlandia corymbosa var. corymbosa TaxID=529605 RepID=A0AAV1E1A3_OLDCO|nr:OLC1v1013334C1 [Oldenlandia corymbosa var. corymbosa]
MKPKRKKSTLKGNPKQLVVADDNDSADENDKKPKKKRMKPENNKLMIAQDPQPISSEDSVKKFETRMTPNHLFQLITEINKPTDLKEEPDAVDYRQLQRQGIRDIRFGALLDLKIKNIPTTLCSFLANNFQTGARQVPLNGNNVLDIKHEDIVVVLDLPRGPKPVEEFKQNDPAITDHAEMVDAFKKRMGYDIREKEMELKIKPDEQAKQTIKILTDAMVSMSRKMPPPSVGKSVPISKEVVVDEQQTQPQGAQGLDQLSQTNDEASLPVGKSVPTSKEVVVDEQQTQPQAHGTNISTTEKKRSHQDSTGRNSGVTSTYTKRSRTIGTRKRKVFKDPTIPHFNLGIFSSQEDSYEITQEKNTEEDITGSVDLDKDVNETIKVEEYPVPSALDEKKNPTPSIDEIIRRASAPASEPLSDTKKLEMIVAAAEQVEKNSKVVEAVPLSIIPPDWNITSTTGNLLMLEKNECTTPPPAISKKADELDEELTKTMEKILNEKPKRRNPPRVHRLPEWFRFFQSYVECVFPRIELVSAQYTLTEVTLPSHKDKTPNAEDCGIYTMHHMERYDGGEYEDGTTLDFNKGNIKEYRWKYMIKILMHPANKNKDKILEAMHQFYTNTAEEEQKEIPDHVDLSSKSYYNDRKIQGWVK